MRFMVQPLHKHNGSVMQNTKHKRSEHTKHPFVTTNHSLRGELVVATDCGDILQGQFAWCVVENFCENRCLCGRILSPGQKSYKSQS